MTTETQEEQVVHEVAILLIAADAVAGEDFRRGEDAIAWARKHDEALEGEPWSNGRHCGDCTKQPHTCLRCVMEEAEERAKELIGT